MVSNKQLSIVLTALIVITIAGVVGLLAKTSSIQPPGHVLTGNALSATGNISITIQETLSITTADGNNINFGDCTPQSGADSVINSEDTQDTPSVCSSFTDGYGNNADILVRNDGNVYANVSINASDWGEAHGGTFIDGASDNSWLAYKTLNDSSHGTYGGGCMGSVQSGYTNITASYNTWMLGCSNLTYAGDNNSFQFEVQAMLPQDATVGSSEVVFTFIAQNA